MAIEVFLALFCVSFVIASLIRPLFGWDRIAFTALAMEADYESVENLHRDVFDSLIARVGEEEFQEMLGRHHPRFRQAMFEDVKVFEQQLNFFRPRFLFTQAVRWLWKAGLDIYLAASLLCSVAVAAGFWFLARLGIGRVKPGLVYLFPAVALMMGLLQIARMSSPDGVAFLFLALSFYFFFRKNWLLFVALPAGVAARPDTVIWAMLVCGFCLVAAGVEKRWRIAAVICAVASLGVYQLVNHLAGHYGWGVLIENTFQGALLYPGEAEGAVTVCQYAKTLAVGILSGANEPAFLAFLIVFLWIAGVTVARHGRRVVAVCLRDRWLGVAVLCAAYVAVHFALFPVLWSRFFVAQYFFVALLFMTMVRVESEQEPVIEEKHGVDG